MNARNDFPGREAWATVLNLALAGSASPNPMEREAFSRIAVIAEGWVNESVSGWWKLCPPEAPTAETP